MSNFICLCLCLIIPFQVFYSLLQLKKLKQEQCSKGWKNKHKVLNGGKK